MKTISLQDAVALIPDGASVMIGGFMSLTRLVNQGRYLSWYQFGR